MTRDELIDRVLKNNDPVEYYRGFLLAGAYRDLRELAGTARDLYVAGRCHLVQRRICEDCFSYLAIPRKKPKPQRDPWIAIEAESAVRMKPIAQLVNAKRGLE